MSALTGCVTGTCHSAIVKSFGRRQAYEVSDHKALWLWGTLKDFESEGLLDKDPNALNAAMLEHMQTTTNEIAPRVAAWLGRIGQ